MKLSKQVVFHSIFVELTFWISNENDNDISFKSVSYDRKNRKTLTRESELFGNKAAQLKFISGMLEGINLCEGGSFDGIMRIDGFMKELENTLFA